MPAISQQFQSFGDIAWYESGYLLPFCVLQLSFGRIYRYYSAKWTMVINIAIFEVGSIICAAAPSSKALIVGRVISGIGGAGVTPGAFLLITFLVPMQSRPKYIGSLGSVFGITSIVGPILGGYLTSITVRIYMQSHLKHHAYTFSGDGVFGSTYPLEGFPWYS